MFYLVYYILFFYYYALLHIALLTNVCFAIRENHLMVHRCHFGLKPGFIYLKNYNQKNKCHATIKFYQIKTLHLFKLSV